MKLRIKKNSEFNRCTGSALILAVVLSTLLALVGVLFVLAARINQMGTSAISENKELDFAVDSVISDASQQLALDIPGLVNPDQEYYDYPDSNNPWLASLEPYESGSDYYWNQISDVTGQLTGKNKNVEAVVVSPYAPVSEFGEDPVGCRKHIYPIVAHCQTNRHGHAPKRKDMLSREFG